MVVKRVPVPAPTASSSNATALLKYICCESACPGAPSNAPGGDGFQHLLYNVDTGADWAELHPLPLTPGSPWLEAVEGMRKALPPTFASGCRNIKPAPAGRFRVERRGRCVSVREPRLHAPVVLMSANDSACRPWQQQQSTQDVLVFPADNSSYIMMHKHEGVAKPCAPNNTAGIILLGPGENVPATFAPLSPPQQKHNYAFKLTAQGTLRSITCADLCAGSQDGTMATMPCSDEGALGFSAVL